MNDNIANLKICTYNVNILFHSGVRVLYSVWVCNLAFTNSTTQNGSLLPHRSAAANPCALKTMNNKNVRKF